MRRYVGHIYKVPDGKGGLEPGELLEATVNEDQMKIYGAYKVPSGDVALIWSRLTEEELVIYHADPGTFFKKPKKTKRKG